MIFYGHDVKFKFILKKQMVKTQEFLLLDIFPQELLSNYYSENNYWRNVTNVKM